MKKNDKNEILEAINSFATDVQSQFNNVQSQFNNMQSQLDDAKKERGEIKATMVTKDYLDDKLADLKGDLIVMIKQLDEKIDKLTCTLEDKNVINDADVKNITILSPFSKQV